MKARIENVLFWINAIFFRWPQMFIFDKDSKTSGYWAVVDCQPDDVACGGAPHKFLKSESAQVSNFSGFNI